MNSPTLDDSLAGWLEIGQIVAPQGLKGEMRVYSTTDFPERFEIPGQRWLLRPQSATPEPVELQQGHYLEAKGLYIIRLGGITTREQAESLRGCRLLVPESDRLPLEAEEFHWVDLIGLEVVHQPTQTAIGRVVRIIPAGNDLLEVKLYAAETPPVLIPLVRDIVPVIDLAAQRLEITPPAGLLPTSGF